MKINKCSLLFCYSIFYALTAFAQKKSNKVDILWGTEFKDARAANQVDVIGYDAEAMYTLKYVGKKQVMITPFTNVKFEYAIESFDNKMNFKNSRKITFPNKKDFEFEFVNYFNDKIHLFYSKKDKGKKEIGLYSKIINKKTLTPDKDAKKLLRVPYERKNTAEFGYDISRDSSKILVWAKMPEVKGQNQKFAFTILEKSGEQLWSKEITVPYKSELFSVEAIQVDNSGRVYLLGLEFDKLSGLIFKGKRKKIKDGKANYSYQILSYSESENYDKIPVQLTGYYITDLQIDISNSTELICAGFYSEKGAYSLRGSCYMKIDMTSHKVLAENTMKFSADFITQNMHGREARKIKKKLEKGKEVELYSYLFRDLVLRDDGGVVLIGEQYYVTVHTTADGRGGITTTYKYHYNNIIVVNINPEGLIDWAEKIPKQQVTSGDGRYTSFVLSVTGDKLYFIFNDDPRNLMVKSGDKIHHFNRVKEATVVLVGIDGKGKQTKEFLFDFDDVKTVIQPTICEQISKKI